MTRGDALHCVIRCIPSLAALVGLPLVACAGTKGDSTPVSGAFPMEGTYLVRCNGPDRAQTTCDAPDSGDVGYGPSAYDFTRSDDNSLRLKDVVDLRFTLHVPVYPHDAPSYPDFTCTFTSTTSRDFTCGPVELSSDACESGDEGQVNSWTITATWTSATEFEGEFHYFARPATDDVAACITDCVITWPFSASLDHASGRTVQRPIP